MMQSTNHGRRRQISISRSTPNLTRLDPLAHSPAIILDTGTPRTVGQSQASMGSSNDPSPEGEEDSGSDSETDMQSRYAPQRSRSSSGSTSSTSSDDRGPAPLLTRSLSSHHIASFAPPFYNRPPTPLPPSPSLTSLLRPSFSTNTSRPTTPDDSENDALNDTEAAVAKSARTAQMVPRASPKVPTYEYYGFVLYLTSSLCFLMYLLWSYLPSPFLHQLGIYYYPDRWWSLAFPAFLVAVIVYIYVALACYNTEVLTLPLNSIGNIVDEAANVAVLDSTGRIKRDGHERKGDKERRRKGKKDRGESRPGRRRDWELDWRTAWSEGTDAVMDVPVGGVCEILYGGD